MEGGTSTIIMRNVVLLRSIFGHNHYSNFDILQVDSDHVSQFELWHSPPNIVINLVWRDTLSSQLKHHWSKCVPKQIAASRITEWKSGLVSPSWKFTKMISLTQDFNVFIWNSSLLVLWSTWLTRQQLTSFLYFHKKC